MGEKPDPFVPSRHQLIQRIKQANRRSWEKHLIPRKLVELREQKESVYKEKELMIQKVKESPEYIDLEHTYNDLYSKISRMEDAVDRERQELIDLLLTRGPTPELLKRIEKFLGIPHKKAKDANAHTKPQA